MAKLQFHGVRGSYPASGPSTVKYGGNTTCFYLQSGKSSLILDAGTGLIGLSEQLPMEGELNILLSHEHWDHIQGLPYLRQFHSKDCEINLYTSNGNSGIITNQMTHPYFPFKYEDIKAKVNFHDNRKIEFIGDIGIDAVPLNHPGGSTGYKIWTDTGILACVWDHEMGNTQIDAEIAMMMSGSDILLQDSCYTVEEYFGKNGQIPRIGWGHSTSFQAAMMAGLIGTDKLYLMHHEPHHDDASLEQILEETKLFFPDTELAKEGVTIEVE